MSKDTGKRKAPVPFTVDAARTELKFVPFKSLMLDREKYSPRPAEEYEPDQLEDLQVDIGANDVSTALLVAAGRGEDEYEVLDGYRRCEAIQLLIEAGVKKFSPEYLVPVHVIAKDASQQAKLARAVSANVIRKPLTAEARMKAACDLFRAGVTKSAIATLLGVSETQVARDIALGNNQSMMKLVTAGFINASTAAALLADATDEKREKDLVIAVKEFGERTLKEIERDNRDRIRRDEKALSRAERQPKKRLTSAQIAAWKRALKTRRPLSEPQFNYFAGVFEDDRKVRWLKILPVKERSRGRRRRSR